MPDLRSAINARAMGRASCAVACLIALACDPGPVTLTDPDSSSSTIPESKLTVELTLDPLDQALADSLGWGDGVPAATVYLLRNGTATWDTLVTDSLGMAEQTVLPGLYRIYAERVLTATEAAKVGDVVRAFGDGRTVPIGNETTVSLQLLADRPGGLVISEVGTGVPVPWETGGTGYHAGSYFEVYNNGSEVAFLDRMIFGVTYFGHSETRLVSCVESAVVRQDPLGVHSKEMLRFPGSGSEYPVEPGGTRLVAMAAIDHRPVHPLLLDLSHADFEMTVEGNADNPAVPNLIDVSLEGWFRGNLTGHTWFLAAIPLQIEDLPILYRDTRGKAYVRVPREALVDVASVEYLWPASDVEYPPCEGGRVHHDHDRYPAAFENIAFDVEHAFSTVRGYQRRALRRALDGRTILFNTKTSAVDLEWVLKTPGWIPEPNP